MQCFKIGTSGGCMLFEELEALPKHTILVTPRGDLSCFIGLNKSKTKVAVCDHKTDSVISCLTSDVLEWKVYVDEKAILEQQKEALVLQNATIQTELNELLTLEATAELLLAENQALVAENTTLKQELINLGGTNGSEVL